ncbi:FAD-linked oxidoreductase [Lentinula guzmanii]|uniref:Proline dehydrogenase n=1 Tax=Lentinula guzmanii TaxID=2804957 RepID=A0AA38JMT3_9AGAR|nr:FAD-linked oxidoreductase [Lentinula guzmanii]
MLVRRVTQYISTHATVSSTVSRSSRHFSKTSVPTPRRSSRLKLIFGGIFVSASGLGYFTLHGGDDNDHATKPRTPLSTLLRSYCVFAMCSIPPLVDKSPAILGVLTSIPGIRQLTYVFVRNTFFNQFVGGETPQDCVPLLKQLCAENKGGILTYSVEVGQATSTETTQEGRARVKDIVRQTIQSIDAVANTMDAQPATTGDRSLWIAIKLTGLVPHTQSLTNLSIHLTNSRKSSHLSPHIPYPGCPMSSELEFLIEGTTPTGSTLTVQDISDLRELYADLEQICMHCKKRGVKILIDAEHSWFEPAIDAMGLSLMRKFNSLSDTTNSSPLPLVYVTFQAYLRRNKDYLIRSLEDAKAENFSLGVKLVRGAYQALEIQQYKLAKGDTDTQLSLSISPESQLPTWSTKLETDQCYNDCIRILISALHEDIVDSHNPHVGIMFGTHNSDSCELILEELVRYGLAKISDIGVITIPPEVSNRMTIAQLYGMSDVLSESLVARTRTQSPLVVKSIPYGALSEVMPYLSRRAIENKSVLGQGKAVAERKRAGEEIWRFFFRE